MNSLLLKLFEQYQVSIEDRYDIQQIFSILSTQKKKNLINNFESLAIELNKISKYIFIERELLTGKEVNKIKKIILSKREKIS